MLPSVYGGCRGAGVGSRTDTNRGDSADRIGPQPAMWVKALHIIVYVCICMHVCIAIYNICIGALNTYAIQNVCVCMYVYIRKRVVERAVLFVDFFSVCQPIVCYCSSSWSPRRSRYPPWPTCPRATTAACWQVRPPPTPSIPLPLPLPPLPIRRPRSRSRPTLPASTSTGQKSPDNIYKLQLWADKYLYIMHTYMQHL